MKRYALAFTAVLVALLAPQPAGAQADPRPEGRATVFAERDAPVHGIAADREVVFVTEPAVEPGATSRVVALDSRTGQEMGEIPPPPGGFRFPFALRISDQGRLAVLDNAGFPPQGAPKIHEYRYSARSGLKATRDRTIDFAGLPLLFAEDLEVLPGGGYVVSESVIGGLWLVGRDGGIRPGLVPSGPAPLPKLGGCPHTAEIFNVGTVPFSSIGGFAPGVGSLAIRGDDLLFGTSCLGGLHKLALDTLTDDDRPASERAMAIETVSQRPVDAPFESLKGLAVDPMGAGDWVYAADPFRLRLIRVDLRTGERQVVADDSRLFNFSVAATFTSRGRGRGDTRLLVTSDQEYRWAGLNGALTHDAFEPPFLITELKPAHEPPRQR